LVFLALAAPGAAPGAHPAVDLGANADPGRGKAATVPVGDAFQVTSVAALSNPWALAFLPDGRLLVTQKSGQLRIVGLDGQVSDPIPGVPAVAYSGQNGLLDVALDPDFATNRLVYLSFAQPGNGNTSGLAVGRGRLTNDRLKDFQVIFSDPAPVGRGNGHMAGRLAFAPDKTLFVSSGERQMGDPAQSLSSVKGKVLHMSATGQPIASNPFFSEPAAAYVWTFGHRNPLGLAFDPAGRLWVHENGPQGGDELNLVEVGDNYGWPIVSNGTNYGDPPGQDTIPNHHTQPQFNAPEVWWNPSLAPAGMIFYTGSMFPAFRGDAFLGALAGQVLIRVRVTPDGAREKARYATDARIREVEQGPDGAIWLLEDGSAGRLLKLTPL
jgi:glucose/arabinose dehydrogenase